MRTMRGMVTTAVVAATTGASLTYVFLTSRKLTPVDPAHTHHHFAPPPELPSSSKLLIPNINNLTFLPDPDIRPRPRPPRCDYAPLWECLVNGNGGCEVLEQDLRVCLNEAKKSEETAAIVASSSHCDYAPLWECIVNGNGGCEVLETDFRSCLKRSEMMKP